LRAWPLRESTPVPERRILPGLPSARPDIWIAG
jgi:hypothetical protein